MSEAKNPFSRWSERKAAARRGEIVDEPAAELQNVVAEAQDVAEPAPAQPVAPATEEVPVLPSIDELDFHSDYTVFLAKNVPEVLRRAALRKLWTSDPVLANLDGLNDYDEDYHLVDTTITAAQTAYRAGLGYIDEAEKKLQQVEDVLADSPQSAAPAGRTADDALSDDDTLSDNNAAVDKVAATTRHSTASAPDPALPEPAKEPGK